MTKHRYAAKIDANQHDIVELLRAMGYSVEVNHDDILVGTRDQTWWFEIKEPDKLFLQNGTTIAKNAIKPSQWKLLREYRGHYAIVWSLHQILVETGKEKPSYDTGLEINCGSRSSPITRHNLEDVVVNQ